MKLPRRRFLHLAVSAAALPAAPRFARAQSYPTRPVRMMVGFTPGGRPTSPRASLRKRCPSVLASNSLSKTGPVPLPTSRPRRWFARRRMATRCSWLQARIP